MIDRLATLSRAPHDEQIETIIGVKFFFLELNKSSDIESIPLTVHKNDRAKLFLM